MAGCQFFLRLPAPFLLAYALLLSFQTDAQPATDPAQPDESISSEANDEASAGTPSRDEPLTTEIIEESLGHVQDAEGNWADKSHAYVGTKSDDLAIYLDRFFGSPIEDLESADSTIRFITGFEWDEDKGSDVRFRLRGNVHLPRINDRLSLVFNGEEDDAREGQSQRDDNDNQVGLQLNAAKGKRSRFDLTLSISSDLNLKPGARYRFKEDLGEWGRVRYTGRVDYSDKHRFRQRHSVELDYLTGETSLLRWANRIEHGQRSEGVEWTSALSWRYGYSIDSAIAFIIGANGKTEPDIPDFILEDPPYSGPPPEPDSLVTNFLAVIKLRNRIYKDWLFVEFEPGYTRRQRHNFEDRHGVFFGRINFEIHFNRGREAGKKTDRVSPAPTIASID